MAAADGDNRAVESIDIRARQSIEIATDQPEMIGLRPYHSRKFSLQRPPASGLAQHYPFSDGNNDKFVHDRPHQIDRIGVFEEQRGRVAEEGAQRQGAKINNTFTPDNLVDIRFDVGRPSASGEGRSEGKQGLGGDPGTIRSESNRASRE